MAWQIIPLYILLSPRAVAVVKKESTFFCIQQKVSCSYAKKKIWFLNYAELMYNLDS